MPIVSCVVVSTGIVDFNDPVRDYHVERVKKHIDLAAEFGAKRAARSRRIHLAEEVIPPEAQWGWAVDACKTLGDYGEKQNVDIALELEPFRLSLLNNINEMVRFVDDCKHPRVKANIDISHLVLADSSPLDLAKLKGKAAHVHISDCDGKSTATSRPAVAW